MLIGFLLLQEWVLTGFLLLQEWVLTGFLLLQEWYAEFQGWLTVLRGRIQKYDLALFY